MENIPYDEEFIEELKNRMIKKLGKYRKFDVERAVECFIRKNILCIDYNPIDCSENPLAKELNREFIELIKKYRPKDCSVRRFVFTVRTLYRSVLEIMTDNNMVDRPVTFSLNPDYLKRLYPLFKHYNPICVAVAVASLNVPEVPITRICDVISSSERFKGCDPGSLTGMVYKARNMLIEKDLKPY